MIDFFKEKKCRLPLIQAGMVWVSGAKLAAACANEGIIGTLGAGSMKPEVLTEQLQKAKNLCKDQASFERLAVNIPLLYQYTEEQIEISLKAGIKTIITSAGSAKTWTEKIKNAGATVIHVCSSPLLAQKCQDAGVDMVIAEGFEAGGHNGREELTTLTLIPQVLKQVSIPVIAAGGFACGRSLLAALALGANGVQMGTRFVMCQESSAHDKYKQALLQAKANDTLLMMKKHIPVRLFRNCFFEQVLQLEQSGAQKEELVELLGKGRAMKGMHQGDIENGELEIGQIISYIKEIQSASMIIEQVERQYHQAKLAICSAK